MHQLHNAHDLNISLSLLVKDTWWLLTTLTLFLVDPGMMGSHILHSKEKKLGAFSSTSLHQMRMLITTRSTQLLADACCAHRNVGRRCW